MVKLHRNNITNGIICFIVCFFENYLFDLVAPPELVFLAGFTDELENEDREDPLEPE